MVSSDFPSDKAESMMLEDLSEDASVILAKLENKAGYCLSDEQKKQALFLIRSLQLGFNTTVEDVIFEMLRMPPLQHFAQLLNSSSDR